MRAFSTSVCDKQQWQMQTIGLSIVKTTASPWKSPGPAFFPKRLPASRPKPRQPIGSHRTRGCGRPPIRSGHRPVESGVGSDRYSLTAATSGPRERHVIVWFTRKNYAMHRALDPSGLPATFDEWLASMAYAVARAIPAPRVVIDPVRFAAWCRANSRLADSSARAAFAQIVAETAKRRTWWPNQGANGKVRRSHS